MPKYKKNIEQIVKRAEVDSMIERANSFEHKFLIAMLYLTGARPSELLELTREDFEVYYDYVNVLLRTKKRGLPRTIQLWNDAPYVKPIILPYIEWLDRAGLESVFSFKSPTWIRIIVYRASDNKYCPYSFRHSRLTKMAKAGAGPFELMQWKGAKRFDSIRPYIMHSPPPREKAKLYLE